MLLKYAILAGVIFLIYRVWGNNGLSIKIEKKEDPKISDDKDGDFVDYEEVE